MQQRRSGFTIIELVTISAIVALGIGLLLPALQSSRANSREARCRDNLKQISIALLDYHSTHKRYPPGWVARSNSLQEPPRFGWLSLILPQLGESETWEQLNFEQPLPTADTSKILATKLAVYRCPADQTADANPLRDGYGTSNYSGNFGDQPLPRWQTGRETAAWPGQLPTPTRSNGIFFVNSGTSIRDVTDGLTHTFVAGERCLSSYSGIWPGVVSNRFENDAVTDASHFSRPNAAPRSYSSRHPGGINVAMGDGSVRFLANDIDSRPGKGGAAGVFQRLSNRWDGLPVPNANESDEAP